MNASEVTECVNLITNSKTKKTGREQLGKIIIRQKTITNEEEKKTYLSSTYSLQGIKISY